MTNLELSGVGAAMPCPYGQHPMRGRRGRQFGSLRPCRKHTCMHTTEILLQQPPLVTVRERQQPTRPGCVEDMAQQGKAGRQGLVSRCAGACPCRTLCWLKEGRTLKNSWDRGDPQKWHLSFASVGRSSVCLSPAAMPLRGSCRS